MMVVSMAFAERCVLSSRSQKSLAARHDRTHVFPSLEMFQPSKQEYTTQEPRSQPVARALAMVVQSCLTSQHFVAAPRLTPCLTTDILRIE